MLQKWLYEIEKFHLKIRNKNAIFQSFIMSAPEYFAYSLKTAPPSSQI